MKRHKILPWMIRRSILPHSRPMVLPGILSHTCGHFFRPPCFFESSSSRPRPPSCVGDTGPSRISYARLDMWNWLCPSPRTTGPLIFSYDSRTHLRSHRTVPRDSRARGVVLDLRDVQSNWTLRFGGIERSRFSCATNRWPSGMTAPFLPPCCSIYLSWGKQGREFA